MNWLPEIRFINMRSSAEESAELKSQLFEIFDACPDDSRVVTYIERLANAIRVHISVKSPTGKFTGSGIGDNELSAFQVARQQLKSALNSWKKTRNFDEFCATAA